jgi:DNA-directed RNA polymerase specialized sigma24 family protein
MSSETPSVLSRIVTDWSVIQDAREGESVVASKARGELLKRYHKAVLKFLQRKLPDYEANMLASDFALAVMDCEKVLQKADRQHGMFRRYLQRVLGNWVIDHFRKDKRRKKREIAVEVEAAVVDDPADRVSPEQAEIQTAMQECLDRSLAELLKALRGNGMKQWRDQLVARVLKLLADQEAEGGPPYHSLVQLKTERPELGGQDLADALSERAGRTISAANVRQMIHRQRERYAELLVEELARSLTQATRKPITPAMLEEKLIEMELFNTYAREALEKYTQK